MRQRGREREKEKYRENITRGKEYNAMPVTLDILTIRMSEFIQLWNSVVATGTKEKAETERDSLPTCYLSFPQPKLLLLFLAPLPIVGRSQKNNPTFFFSHCTNWGYEEPYIVKPFLLIMFTTFRLRPLVLHSAHFALECLSISSNSLYYYFPSAFRSFLTNNGGNWNSGHAAILYSFPAVVQYLRKSQVH